ncbi:MAG TPA: DUF87 domain-containing protein, partial [Candidatus Paceibacterota bacterium]|nr:DUF87 domain-containing protein [Candidatus Paceibacterota bacterium]
MALEGPARPIASPEEELAYLREQVAAKERELSELRVDKPRETLVHERILHHRETPAVQVLDRSFQMEPTEAYALALNLEPQSDDETMGELRTIMETKGIHNAFSVLDKLKNPHLEDDFHRFLVQYLIAGMPIRGMNEKQPEWKGLHMTLYEIALPEANADDESRRKSLKELISSMEQFYAGMLAVEHATAGEPAHFTLELAVPVNRAHLMFYAAVPNSKRDLFEKQLLAIFPNAHIAAQPNDYNVFVDGGASYGSVAALGRPPMLAFKDYGDFDYDPINSILNAFAKIAPENEGASLQIVLAPQGDRFVKHYRKVLNALRTGEQRSKAFDLPETALGEAARDITQTLFGGASKAKEEDAQDRARQTEANKSDIEFVEKKLASQIVSANLRLVVSSQDGGRAEQILGELESAFHQFEQPTGNRIEWKRVSRGTMRALFHDFTFRTFQKGTEMALSLRELTALFHFPPTGIESSPHLKQSRFTAAAAPLELPHEGVQLGTNEFRGQNTEVFLSPEDRLRHLYIIGQTGTGKTSFMKTLIEQDIKAGNGVCFIDPHGNDILDVLASVPPERYEDVIYFDPAYLDRPFGLNLLEYDTSHPEQKTFIVNELLAIFRRLYGDVPESMGPAFEQYFRNATLLVMEDPATGSTLMDIGRVLSNKEFRDTKLARSNNPIVNQFWNEIATQAGGDAALENIVPYITNKFDDFTANDFMRPIIGQQESSFNFRAVMDKRKILLVNLSKGR